MSPEFNIEGEKTQALLNAIVRFTETNVEQNRLLEEIKYYSAETANFFRNREGFGKLLSEDTEEHESAMKAFVEAKMSEARGDFKDLDHNIKSRDRIWNTVITFAILALTLITYLINQSNIESTREDLKNLIKDEISKAVIREHEKLGGTDGKTDR